MNKALWDYAASKDINGDVCKHLMSIYTRIIKNYQGLVIPQNHQLIEWVNEDAERFGVCLTCNVQDYIIFMVAYTNGYTHGKITGIWIL